MSQEAGFLTIHYKKLDRNWKESFVNRRKHARIPAHKNDDRQNLRKVSYCITHFPEYELVDKEYDTTQNSKLL